MNSKIVQRILRVTEAARLDAAGRASGRRPTSKEDLDSLYVRIKRSQEESSEEERVQFWRHPPEEWTAWVHDWLLEQRARER
jgi:hypothetical protein